MNFAKLITIARTGLRLGVRNIGRVALYRALCKLGMGPVSIVPHQVHSGAFFRKDHLLPSQFEPVLFNGLRWFGWFIENKTDEAPPNWFYNPFTGKHYSNADKPWFELPDFSPDIGDIKCVWEQSRFHWALMWAQNARTTGNVHYIDTLNNWIADWLVHNPGYIGPNWKCGQEASIRVMHIYFTARLLGQHQDATLPLKDFIWLHLQRIAPTLMYALSQDNNHGTSEAAALFIGGCWLEKLSTDCPQAAKWGRTGRKWLEERVCRLIMDDGTFSQYSVNYHRVLLDTLCMVELFRRDIGLEKFSDEFYRRSRLATHWLHSVTQPSGDASNIGANDGAQLLPLSNADYRDFRPSLQLASTLFFDAVAYGDGPWNLSLYWLGLAIPEARLAEPVSKDFSHGGLAFLKNETAAVYVRYPRFKFRPSQADLLHLDLWLGNKNILRDAGSYSYNCPPPWQEYFSSISAHNTIQFGSWEPMPKISRFLFGRWACGEVIEPLIEQDGKQVWQVRYKDQCGAIHARRIELSQNMLSVVDDILIMIGSFATLRWHLFPSNWELQQNMLVSDLLEIEISGENNIVSMSLVESWESKYYHQKTLIPVLEVVISRPGRIKSNFNWQKSI